MSLVAAMLIGASAFAIDNVKVDGDAKLFYSTAGNDNDVPGGGLFDKKTSMGQAALGLGITADLTKGISAGAHLTALSTLGLEGQLVNGVWEGTNGVDDSFWFDEAWVAGTVGNTTGKVGRMTLDTPLVFTETWSIAYNTFEAAVLLNSDLPDTTLVAAYVGGSNGGDVANRAVIAPFNANGTTNFDQFYNGAYAFGAINNSFKPLTAQAWYYDATSVLTAYWLQADLNIDGIVGGLQYTAQEVSDADSQAAYAVKLGYEADAFTVSAAYSSVDDEANGLPLVGANLAASGQSKLYTEAWWNYGYISQVDTTAMNVTGTYSMADVADFGIYFTSSTNDTTDVDMTEVTLEAARSYGPLDAGLYYIYTAATDQNDDDAYSTVQVYLTYNF